MAINSTSTTTEATAVALGATPASSSAASTELGSRDGDGHWPDGCRGHEVAQHSAETEVTAVQEVEMLFTVPARPDGRADHVRVDASG